MNKQIGSLSLVAGIIIGLFIVIVSVVGLYFYSQKSSLENASNVPPALPTQQQSLPLPESSLHSTTADERPSVDSNVLQSSLTSFLNEDNLEIDETNTGNINGCKIITTSKMKIKQGNYFYLSESNYADEQSKLNCNRQSLYAVYNEVYWVEGKIYARQNKNKPIEVIPADSKIALPLNPKEYLSKLFSALLTVEILSTQVNYNSTIVKAKLTKSDYSGQFSFEMAQKDLKINGYSFSMTQLAGGLSLELSGDVSIKRGIEDISRS